MDNDYYDEELHVDLRDLHEVKKIDTAINTLADKIKSADNYDNFLTAVASFYDFAYRRGYDAGLKDNKKEDEVDFEITAEDLHDYMYGI